MKKGLILLMVMFILFMMGTEFYILNSTSSIIAAETNIYFLEADKDNLFSSVKALLDMKKYRSGEEIDLNTKELAWEGSKTTIKIENPKKAVINIFSKRGTQEINTQKEFNLQ
ncbi:MAG: hypothetical protein ABFD79_17580 [Phycisphaerales bacterium]